MRETERLVKKLANPVSSTKTPHSKDPDTQRLENDLSEKLGAKVFFQVGKKGKGKVVIEYNSLDELDGILSHIK